MVPKVPGTAAQNRVRVRRKALRVTQAELAKQVHVSRQTIVSLEQGDYAPSVYLALRIAATLSATVEDLFGSPDPSTAEESATSKTPLTEGGRS